MRNGLGLSFSIGLLALVACSNGGGGSDAGPDATTETGPPTCFATSSCESASETCYYPINGACSLAGNTGVCLAFTATAGCTPNVACGCDGTTITVCAPAGYVDRNAQMAGPCPVSDAGSDASDAGADAASE